MRRILNWSILALLGLGVVVSAPTVFALRQEPGNTPKSSQAKVPKAADQETERDREPDVVFWPTPQVVVDKMLELAEVKKGDLVYDLGSGDGRIVIRAAKKFGARAVGIEADSTLIAKARAAAKAEGFDRLLQEHPK